MYKPSATEKDLANARFSENALKIFKKRYLVEMEDGTQETPADMFVRVANALAEVDKDYGKDQDGIDKVAKDFYDIMARKEFTPAGRTLRNAGSETPLIANCVVLAIEDSMGGIFQTLKEAALLQQVGCGLGFDFSSLRPAGTPTKRTQGVASGPVSFLRAYNEAFKTIKQQARHGANMAMMRVDHPDVLDFIRSKRVEGEIACFNISVTITDEFMRALEEDPDQLWYCQFKGRKMKPNNVHRLPNGTFSTVEEANITVRELWNELVNAAWTNGEPGIAFIDNVNRTNPLPGLGPITCSNPCGEQFLHPYDNCNLGSLNLAAFAENKTVNWERLGFATGAAVRMLDSVIDKFDFPVDALNKMARGNRRIGLGIMGFADMLYQLGIKYDSVEGFAMGEKVMGFIQEQSHRVSQALGEEKGSFPNIKMSVYANQGIEMRNAALTTVAPTGSISMIFDTSSGIEPNFALYYIKQDKDGHQYHYFNRYFEQALNTLDISEADKERIMQELREKGSVQQLDFLSQEIRDTFVISTDISGEDHMKMQAVFQKHVDNSISKTINYPNEATKEEISQSFVSAWKLGVKSCTVYRDGSRTVEVLNLANDKIVSPTEFKGNEASSTAAGASQPPKETFGGPHKIEPRKRPDVLNGKTYRIKTGYGNLYVTINSDEKGDPFEVFATIGKSGGYFQEQSEAITRLISLALRSGVAVEKVIDDLKGIRGPMPVFTDKGTVLSLPDALGKIIEEHVKGTPKVEEILRRPENQEVLAFAKADQAIADFGFMPGCPDCGAALTMGEGCMSCSSCGFSRCT